MSLKEPSLRYTQLQAGVEAHNKPPFNSANRLLWVVSRAARAARHETVGISQDKDRVRAAASGLLSATYKHLEPAIFDAPQQHGKYRFIPEYPVPLVGVLDILLKPGDNLTFTRIAPTGDRKHPWESKQVILSPAGVQNSGYYTYPHDPLRASCPNGYFEGPLEFNGSQCDRHKLLKEIRILTNVVQTVPMQLQTETTRPQLVANQP